MDQSTTDADKQMMRRCLEVAARGGSEREFPFAAVICRHGKVVSEAANHVTRERDVTRHAELVAISKAQRLLGSIRLSGCTLYSIVEPCAMCSFPIRETRIGRVVFSLSSPLMGGGSRWDVLRDKGLSTAMPELFGHPPEIVAGVLAGEAEKVWNDWNPVIWRIISKRGCFCPDHSTDARLASVGKAAEPNEARGA